MLLSPDESVYRSAEVRPSSLRRHRRKLLASPLWLLLLGGYGLYAWGPDPRPPGTSNGEKAKRRTMVRRQTHRSRPFWIVAASAVVVDLYGVAG